VLLFTRHVVAAAVRAAAAACRQGQGQQGEEVLMEGRARIIKQGNDVFFNEAQVRGCRVAWRCGPRWLPRASRCL
jgi:hypothetical protein